MMRVAKNFIGQLLLGLLLLVLSETAVHAQVWTNIGPYGAMAPNITSAAVDPANPARWLIRSGSGGLFETDNARRTGLSHPDLIVYWARPTIF